MQTITPNELQESVRKGAEVRLIDVRTPIEYRAAHVEFAELQPLDQLEPKNCGVDSKDTIYLICETGSRAAKACERFESAGIHKAVVVEGGTRAWIDAGLPVRRGKKAISLERQVRIGAGALVLLGVLLGWLLHPGFYGISAFVGAGLLFAGVTDTCGMSLMLAKAPWNRVDLSNSAKSCSVQE